MGKRSCVSGGLAPTRDCRESPNGFLGEAAAKGVVAGSDASPFGDAMRIDVLGDTGEAEVGIPVDDRDPRGNTCWEESWGASSAGWVMVPASTLSSSHIVYPSL